MYPRASSSCSFFSTATSHYTTETSADKNYERQSASNYDVASEDAYYGSTSFNGGPRLTPPLSSYFRDWRLEDCQWQSADQTQSPRLDITERLQPSPVQLHSATVFNADRWSPCVTSSAGVAPTTSLTATPPTPSLYLLPTPSLRSSENLL